MFCSLHYIKIWPFSPRSLNYFGQFSLLPQTPSRASVLLVVQKVVRIHLIHVNKATVYWLMWLVPKPIDSIAVWRLISSLWQWLRCASEFPKYAPQIRLYHWANERYEIYWFSQGCGWKTTLKILMFLNVCWIVQAMNSVSKQFSDSWFGD